MGGGGPIGVCPGEVSFVGQMTGSGSDVPDGGSAILDPYAAEYQAGIADVKSAIPEMHSDVAEVEIEVRSATVVATDYATDRGEISRSQTNFWIADGDGTMEVRLYHENVTPEEVPQFAVQVGQKISFDVTQVGRYYDKGQIQRGSNWVLEDVDQDVYVWEPDRAFDVADVIRCMSHRASRGRALRMWRQLSLLEHRLRIRNSRIPNQQQYRGYWTVHHVRGPTVLVPG